VPKDHVCSLLLRVRARRVLRGCGESVSQIAGGEVTVTTRTPPRRGIRRECANAIVVDLYELARRDHEDLDRALDAMVAHDTPPREQLNLLDVFRLCLAVHLVAESRVFGTLLSLIRPPAALRGQIAQLRAEHEVQQRVAERLASIEPGTDDWYSVALELRVLVLDHAKREDYLRDLFDDYIPPAVARAIASQYATERMKLLGTTSPLMLASTAQVA
jgi:hypothetical protein